MNEDLQFIDTESSFSGSKDSISFQQIVLRHLFSISKFASLELRGGYWQKKAIPVNGSLITSEEYISDTRETYSNAVNHLQDLLLPYFDKTMLNDSDVYKQKLDDVYKNTTSNIKDFDESLNVREFKTDDFEVIYKKKRYDLSRLLFQKLSLFMKRNGYLQTKDLEIGE